MATSRRARSLAAARQAAADAQFLRRAKGFIRLLRQQAGIPVRQPAHQQAPFRAVPICAWGSWTVTAPASNALATGLLPVVWDPTLVGSWASGTTPGTSNPAVGTLNAAFGASNGIANATTFGGAYTTPRDFYPEADYTDETTGITYQSGAPQFPDGQLGFITGLQVWCMDNTNEATCDNLMQPIINNARFSWLIDGKAVPGFRNALPGQQLALNQSVLGPTLPGTVLNLRAPDGGYIDGNQLGCAVQVQPGQRSWFAGHVWGGNAGSSTTKTFVFRLVGYRIPTKTDDGTILGTLTD